MENYMNNYDSPEAFIRAEVLSNRGTDSIVMKNDLLQMAQRVTDEALTKLSKAELFDLLVEKVGSEVYTMFPVGVSSFCFQLKFDIDHTAVKRLAKAGVIRATGRHRFRLYGKNRYADTYSPYDYFRLTPEEIHAWLEAHPNSKKKSQSPVND